MTALPDTEAPHATGDDPTRWERVTNLGHTFPLWLAASVMLGVAAMAALVALNGGHHRAAPSPTPAATAPATSAPAPHATHATHAPLDTSQQVPSTTPAGLTWRAVQGVPLPYSATAGPTRLDGAVAAGYARTPLGALLAAQQIAVRCVVAPADGWRQVTLQQVVPDAGQRVWLAARAGVGDAPPAGGYGQPAGFAFVNYSPDTASVQLVSRFAPDGALQVATVTVRWVAGDWKLQLLPTGAASPTAQLVPSIYGYVPWGSL